MLEIRKRYLNTKMGYLKQKIEDGVARSVLDFTEKYTRKLLPNINSKS